jgi:hypothetical protein
MGYFASHVHPVFYVSCICVCLNTSLLVYMNKQYQTVCLMMRSVVLYAAMAPADIHIAFRFIKTIRPAGMYCTC